MSLVVSKSSQAVSKLKRRRDGSPDSAGTSSSISELEQTDDAPVLSHAAKRKQKKAALLKEEDVPAKSSTKKQKKEEDAPHSIKRQNSVWVGNLCYKTTPESLRRFFDGVGEITRVHLPTKLVNASQGELARRENRGCVSDLLLNCSCFFFAQMPDRQGSPMWTLRRQRRSKSPSRCPSRHWTDAAF